MSKALWYQMLGRATRIAEGKSDFLVLDHSNNTIKHGFIEDERIGNLEPMPKSNKGSATDVVLHECKECLAIFKHWPCPSCGAVKEKTAREIEIDTKAELKELTKKTRDENIIKQIIATARAYGHKKGRCWYQLKEAFGEDEGHRIYMELVYPMPWVPLRSQDQPNNTIDFSAKPF
jgi:superfamily II DNA or RNA helicase